MLLHCFPCCHLTSLEEYQMNKMLIALTAALALSSNAFAAAPAGQEAAGFGVGTSTIAAGALGAAVLGAAIAAGNQDSATATTTVTATN